MKAEFSVTIQKFGQQGEKTGWTYILIPSNEAEKINPGVRKSFRVKGKLDAHAIKGVALIPMGDGDFIIPLNASLRRAVGKKQGHSLKVSLSLDKEEYQQDFDFIACLKDEPAAWNFFQSLTKSHQNYFSKWIESAKTEATKAKRIAMAVNGLAKKMDYGAMIRASRGEK